MRPVPVFLSLLFTATLTAAMRFAIETPETLDPERPAVWRVTIENVSGTDLPAAPLVLSVGPATIHRIEPELGCRPLPGSSGWNCTLPALRAGHSVAIEITGQTPFRHGRVGTSVAVTFVPGGAPERLDDLTIYWKDYPVTTTADAGPGSLRQAILDINAGCQNRYPDWTPPCRAAFHIAEPLPEEGWYTIRPLSPLPAVTAWDAAIDGTTQSVPSPAVTAWDAAIGGPAGTAPLPGVAPWAAVVEGATKTDTAANARGPVIALEGSALVSGSGITARSRAYVMVRGLAIGGFPENGIDSHTLLQLTVKDCYIGVDPSGRRAHPNGSRGIASTVMTGTIERNVIGGNARSGIWFMAGEKSTGPHIRDNRIGVAAHDDTPIGNGASGIFIGDFHGYYAFPTIEGNVIANNAHFGIALTANAPMIILGNTIRANGAGGIDIGLDGPTESRPGTPGVMGGVVPPPVIVSARYADGVTTITGYSSAGSRRQVLLYANAELEPGGYAEGEQYLGITAVLARENTFFTFVYPGDLRGKYINGTSYAVTQWGWDESSFTSSEFGRAVAVE